MKRLVLAATAAVLVLVAVQVVRVLAARPGGVMGYGRIAPVLTVVGPSAEGTPKVPVESTVTLRLTLAAPAWVYVFDEFGGKASLVLPHPDSVPWEPGTYESESAVLEQAGQHRIGVIASTKQRFEWKGTTLDALLAACGEGCELANVTVEAFGEKPHREFPKLGAD